MGLRTPPGLRIAAILAVLPALVLKAIGGLDHRVLPLSATILLVLVSIAYAGFWLAGGSGRLAQVLAPCTAALSLTAVLVPGTPTYMTFLWLYTAVMVGFVLEPRMAILAELAVILLAAVTAVIASNIGPGGWPEALARSAEVVLIVPVAGLAAISVAQLLRSNAALVEARESLARLAVQEERARFSRDLHDVLGHTLSLVGIKVQLARRVLAVNRPEADSELHQVEGLIKDSLDAMREVASGYRQPTVAGQLSGAHAALTAAGIQLAVQGEVPLLAPEVEGAIAWVIREGVTNVIQHSRARNCRITFRRQAEAVSVEIVDDGRGPCDGAIGGLGLHSLRERLKPLGGKLRSGAGMEAGYVLCVEVPTALETSS